MPSLRSFGFAFALLGASIVLPTAYGAPSTAGYSAKVSTLKERVNVPHGWIQRTQPPPAHHIIELRVGLPQPNFDLLQQHLYEVSDPNHERYGNHLSKEEVEEIVAPHEDSLNAVDAWLRGHGLGEEDVVRSPAKDWVTLRLPVGMVEKMLDTKYSVWEHSKTGDTIVRTTEYSLPAELHEHIEVIQPTTMFAQFKPQRSTLVWGDGFGPDSDATLPPLTASRFISAAVSPPGTVATVDPSCSTVVTISCLQQLYNAVGYVPDAKIGNSIGITGYLEEWANQADLQTFYKEQRADAVGSGFQFFGVAGGVNNQSVPGAEANLDVQFAFGLSYPIPATFYSTAGSPPYIPDSQTTSNSNEPYADWLDFISGQENVPLTISTSYGDDEQTVPESYAIRVCAEFAKLGARGVSLLFSSGDSGVGDGESDPTEQNCFANDGTNARRFLPAFPASCPYVTSVGGTQGVAPEVAVSRFYSGGGFSNYFPTPDFQKEAVEGYLEKLPTGTYAGLYNPQGRGIPDVSAQGDNFRIIYGGRAVRIGGTSASAPTFAGFVALLNDARLKAGLSPLGWLNPLLYSSQVAAGHGLTDILSGRNPGCGTTGFNVTAGWDPVTGLGTPNFGALKGIVLA